MKQTRIFLLATILVASLLNMISIQPLIIMEKDGTHLMIYNNWINEVLLLQRGMIKMLDRQARYQYT
jgi:hypothetical protein